MVDPDSTRPEQEHFLQIDDRLAFVSFLGESSKQGGQKETRAASVGKRRRRYVELFQYSDTGRVRNRRGLSQTTATPQSENRQAHSEKQKPHR